MLVDDPNRDPIEVLADLFLQQHRDGYRPTIQQFARQYPEHSQDILDLFPMLLDLERLKESDENSRPRPATAGDIPQKTLGDFQILSEIGRGGMGIVYLARQKSLGRSVALKVLSKSLSSSPQQVQRFHQEAEAAAKLHHTNIVPVYGVGQQDDFHYYAMQWIDGIGLEMVIAQLAEDPLHIPANEKQQQSDIRKRLTDSGSLLHNSYFRNVARIAADIADALAYAHQHEVLHRDVKPSNILLDASGDAWITDFGLAKLADDKGLTQTGELIGTLRYMAPEQFDGKVDQRSDVYSLGLTIYELLTLNPAFAESQHARLLNQRTRGTITPPRQIHPQIPRDLETIVVTACATEPIHRYQSAGELQADLQAFLEGRPIQARRISSMERLWRWCRRNPAIAGSIVSVATLLITAAAVSGGAYVQTLWALTEVSKAKTEADQARVRAEDNLRLAVDAFDSIFDNVTQRGVPETLSFESDQPNLLATLTPADAQLLNQLLEFYQAFADQNVDDLELQLRILSARRRMGQIQTRLGEYEVAQESFTLANQMASSILRMDPTNLDATRTQVALLNDLGELLYVQQDKDDQETSKPWTPGRGFAYHQKVIESVEDLPDTLRHDPEIQFQLARAFDLMGSTMFRSQLYAGILDFRPHRRGGQRRGGEERRGGRPPSRRGDRPAEARPAMPGRLPPPGQNPDGRPPERPNDPFGQLAQMWMEPTARPLILGPGKGPLPDIETAIEILEPLVLEHPLNPDYASLLAKALQHRYVFLLNERDRQSTTEAFRAAEARIRASIKNQPENPQLKLDLADHLSTASVRSTLMKPNEAQQLISESVQLSEDLCLQFQDVPEYQALLASAHRSLADTLAHQQQWAEAQKHLAIARETLESLTQQSNLKYYSWSLAVTLMEQAQLALDRPEANADQYQQAIADLQEAIRICSQSDNQSVETSQQLRSAAYELLAKLYTATNEPELAKQAEKEARQQGNALMWDWLFGPAGPPDEPRGERPGSEPPRKPNDQL